jgi:hypothetical protein
MSKVTTTLDLKKLKLESYKFKKAVKPAFICHSEQC